MVVDGHMEGHRSAESVVVRCDERDNVGAMLVVDFSFLYNTLVTQSLVFASIQSRRKHIFSPKTDFLTDHSEAVMGQSFPQTVGPGPDPECTAWVRRFVRGRVNFAGQQATQYLLQQMQPAKSTGLQ